MKDVDLKALLAAATRRPWQYDGETEVTMSDDICAWIASVNFDGVAPEQAEADANLIALAPTLAARVIELEAALRLAHDTMHETTAVLTASDCAKVAEVMAVARAALSGYEK